MPKFVPKTESVDAIQVQFGKGGWPEWLDGHLKIATYDKGGVAGGSEDVLDGQYLVCEDGEPRVMSAEEFEKHYKRARAPKGGQAES